MTGLLLNLMPGSSYSRMGDPTLPSALRRFTSELGMGSGGTTALRPPGKFCFIRPLLRSDLICIRLKIFSHPPKHLRRCKVKPHGSLVPVSSTHRCAYTPGLSTSSSSTFLQDSQGVRRTHLGASFVLRCFQHLSLPHLATGQCHWHDNPNTSDASTPVLSY